MPPNLDSQSLARGVLDSVGNDLLVLRVSGTDYKLHLVPTVPAGEIATPPGKRIKGTIRATALRMHPAQGGGRFIEPVWGAPRIVAGQVMAVDGEKNRVLVDACVPIWVRAPEGQDSSVIREGELINFHVESGATFTPVIEASD